jgi:hypothetical protein
MLDYEIKEKRGEINSTEQSTGLQSTKASGT